MRARCTRLFLAFATVAAAFAAERAGAEISAATLYRIESSGAGASAPDFPYQSETSSLGPITTDVYGQSGSDPLDVSVVRGSAYASATGSVSYRTNLVEVRLDSSPLEMRTQAEPPESALASLDAVLQISFQVDVPTTFAIVGHVSSLRDLAVPEVVACQWNGVVLAGDTRATPLAAGTYPFTEERTVYPLETAVVECAAATSGGMTDRSALSFELVARDVSAPEPDAGLATLAALGTLGALTARKTHRR